MRRLPFLVLLLTGACAARTDDLAGDESLATEGVFQETTSTALPNQPCGTGATRGCYTNYAITADLDGDGKLDLVMANGGGHFVPTTAEPQVVYFGDGTGAFADGAAAFQNSALSIVRQVAVADFDGDGKLDVYLPGGYGLHDDQLFMQNGPRSFVNDPARIGATKSSAGAVHAGDIDNDGDIDLVVADWGSNPNPDGSTPPSLVKVRIQLNDGTGHFTPGAVLEAPDGSSATDIDLQDVNGDFTLDLVLTQRNGQSRLYLNDGGGRFEDVTARLAFPRKRGPYTFNGELCDVDNDGDLDLLFDGGAVFVANHATQLLINDGHGKFTDETDRIVGELRSDDNQVKCGDVDNDGDFDLVVASLANPSEKLFRNDGTGHFTLVPGALPPLRDPTLAIDFGDFDGDGRIDLMTAQGEVRGAPWIERIFRNTSPAVDARKPVFRAIEKPRVTAGRSTPLRLAVTDAHTSETGQHVKNVGFDVTVGGTTTSLPASFVGGDIFRATLPSAPAGTVVTVTPRATDRRGNEAVGTPFEIVVAP